MVKQLDVCESYSELTEFGAVPLESIPVLVASVEGEILEDAPPIVFRSDFALGPPYYSFLIFGREPNDLIPVPFFDAEDDPRSPTYTTVFFT